MPPVNAVVNTTAVVVEALHTYLSVVAANIGGGFIVILNVSLVPTQLTPPLVNVGVTIIVEVIAVEPVLVAVKLGIVTCTACC